ncbi:hypothetical protein HY449_03590 [Candidatus Pacearchaeota archaeon]|nr:hypothetical protein [Candidatus Pacearchaeota archaeon]
MGKTEKDKVISITRQEVGIVEAIVGGSHYETDILDEKGRIHSGAGNTSEESQKNASEKYREAHRDDSISSSSDSGDKGNDSGNGGGCYLTTACISARDLPDNCLELNVLRNFRDRILLQNPTGRKSVKEYYKIAPEIVQSINERGNSSEIWNSVYQDITKAVQLVLSGDFNRAFEHYKEMTLRLKN